MADIWLADLLDWSDDCRRIDGLIYRLMEPMFELVESARSGATSVVMQGVNTGMVNHYPFGHAYVERAVVDEIDPNLGYDLVGTLIVLDDGSNWFTGQRMDNSVARRFFHATNATPVFIGRVSRHRRREPVRHRRKKYRTRAC
ncbi:MAG: hypothetical protein ACT4QA_03815 [Panacagrimonas sp.]